MKEKEFREKLSDALELYFNKEEISDDVLNHLITIVEKLSREKCNDYKANIIEFLTNEWELDTQDLKESLTHGIHKAPLPEFNWLVKKY